MSARVLVENGDITIAHSQDCDPILDWNKEARRDTQHSDWGRHVARIPNVILIKWFDEAWARGQVGLRLFSPEFDEICERKLKDPEWAYLRCDAPSHQVGFLMPEKPALKWLQ